MGSFGNFLENEILDNYFGGQDYEAPANLHIALSTTDPTDDGSGISEPSGNGYERKQVANNKTTFDVASGGALANAIVIEFAEASGSWGTITHFAIFDAAEGGNMLAHGALSASKAVESGDIVRFPIGDLDITLD